MQPLEPGLSPYPGPTPVLPRSYPGPTLVLPRSYPGPTPVLPWSYPGPTPCLGCCALWCEAVPWEGQAQCGGRGALISRRGQHIEAMGQRMRGGS